MTEKLKKHIERLGWEVSIYDNGVYLSKYSPAGEDFGFLVDDDDDGDIIYEILQYAKHFDADDHAAMHIANRGMNGTPSSVRELIEDAEYIAEELHELGSKLKLYNPYELETYQDVQETIGVRKANEDFNYYNNREVCIIHAKFGGLQKRYTGLKVENGLTEEFVEEYKKYFENSPSIFETPQDIVRYVIQHDLPVIFYSNFKDVELSKAELLEYFNMEDVWKD